MMHTTDLGAAFSFSATACDTVPPAATRQRFYAGGCDARQLSAITTPILVAPPPHHPPTDFFKSRLSPSVDNFPAFWRISRPTLRRRDSRPGED